MTTSRCCASGNAGSARWTRPCKALTRCCRPPSHRGTTDRGGGTRPAARRSFFRVNALLLRNPSVVNMLDGCALSLPCQTRRRVARGSDDLGRRVARRHRAQHRAADRTSTTKIIALVHNTRGLEAIYTSNLRTELRFAAVCPARLQNKGIHENCSYWRRHHRRHHGL